MTRNIELVADRYGVSNGKAKKIIRRKAAKRGKHDYVAPKRGMPVKGTGKPKGAKKG